MKIRQSILTFHPLRGAPDWPLSQGKTSEREKALQSELDKAAILGFGIAADQNQGLS